MIELKNTVKEGEDLIRAARDLQKKMSEEERQSVPQGKVEAHGKRQEQRPSTREAKRGHAGKEEPKSGKATSDVRGAKSIESVNDHEDGQSLATRKHGVIMHDWAEERKAQPTTVGGTEHEGRARVLSFDFPGYGGGLEAISWDEWFEIFDGRGLTFLCQEHLKNGNQSSFFKMTTPNREDG
jgi:hypothetical protein